MDVTAKTHRRSAEQFFGGVIVLTALVFFGFLSVVSLVQTCSFDETVGIACESVIFPIDNLLFNLLVIGGVAVILFAIGQCRDVFSAINVRAAEIGVAVWAAALGVIWVLMVASVPDSDSMSLFEAATKAAQGDFSPLYNARDSFNSDFYNGHSYFNFYPFQLGYVLLSELVYRIFGVDNSLPMQLLNALCLGAAYFALARMTGLLFKKKSAECVAILLLALCFQPILMCTFAYGNLIGMTAAIWASLLLIKYFQTDRYRWLVGAALLLTAAVVVKYNNLIYLIAFVLLLLIHTVKRRRWQNLAFAMAMCLMCFGAVRLVIFSYEVRAETQLERGLSQVMYLDLGLQESSMCSGWFTRTAIEDYEEGGYDVGQANAIALQHIGQRGQVFLSNPGYALQFFTLKYLSQWNEPSYESIWVSQVKGHLRETNAFVKDVYTGTAGHLLHLHFNQYMQLLFLSFSFGLFWLFTKRRVTVETTLLPLVLLGAVAYHLLSEAKSQYALTYVPLLIPTAAYAIQQLFIAEDAPVRTFGEGLLKKRKEKQEDAAKPEQVDSTETFSYIY